MSAPRLFAMLVSGRTRPLWTCFGLLILLLCMPFVPLSAQDSGAPFTIVNQKKQAVRIPFELQRNLIVVSAKLNGKGPYNFLLDTGVGISLITDPSLRQTLNLPIGNRFQVAGAGEENAIQAFQSDGVRVELPGVVAPALSFLVLSEDVLNLSGYVGVPIHGILGYDIFRSFVVEVRPVELVLRFHDPYMFRQPQGRSWTTIPLQLQGNKAYITTEVVVNDQLALPLKLVLDTGAGHALSLEVGSDPRLQLPPIRLRSQLGRGLSGYINGFLGRVTALQIGKYRLKSLLTSFPDADNVQQRVDIPRNGNVGFELLKRFNMIIDYPHAQLMLRPNGLYRDPFEHDMSGFDLMATGPDLRRYIIMKVQPDSPASAANLHPNDEIVSINLQPASSMSLTQISRLLHSADGRLLLLIVRRSDGHMYTTALQLKRQI
ncbi:aspartyl protease family protein [Hymenobacter jejuensis]|uniref:PDZ domain-containing protein n=1 Tax=Hymenobacter jejuensis TaxID=2502781 RepID=A0A5B8A2I5_9BACT|nr:aspartyl protease family protein [Hymenobacter jejuensis]QDA61369.1 PDZ domain-containing protein [Hymenobacter jejuensis]